MKFNTVCTFNQVKKNPIIHLCNYSRFTSYISPSTIFWKLRSRAEIIITFIILVVLETHIVPHINCLLFLNLMLYHDFQEQYICNKLATTENTKESGVEKEWETGRVLTQNFHVVIPKRSYTTHNRCLHLKFKNICMSIFQFNFITNINIQAILL